MGCKSDTIDNMKNDKTSEGNNGKGGREAGQDKGDSPMKAGMGMMSRMMGGMRMDSMMPPMAKRMTGEAQTMAEGNEGTGPMKAGMGMMNKMMGKMKDENFNPMEMCRRMGESVAATAEIAGFATPEVRALFEDWASEVEKEILNVIKEAGQVNPLSIAEKFKISEDSALYFISKLVRDKKIKVNAEFTDETLNEQTAQTGEADAENKGDTAGESSQAANNECAGGVCSVDTAAAETKKTRQK
jgi:hypothetical protein